MHQRLSKEIKITDIWQAGRMDGSDFGGGDGGVTCGVCVADESEEADKRATDA
jgi:hypothetical protein